MSELVELLFFDTFAHDNTEEINLDLVQFPKPVYVTEVRIIPLGARVQADFPGGVRLGATNPSQFQIEFFVNDLGKPGASTFESLGGFEYNQNGCINLDCVPEDILRKIPTDGLVLRGWYTTITLAVYGTLTNSLTEQIIPTVVNPSLPTQQSSTIADVQQIISSGVPLENEWQNPENIAAVPVEYQNTQYQPNYNQTQETYNNSNNQEYNYYDVPKDPRNYHHTPTNEAQSEWDSKTRTRTSDGDRTRDLAYQKTGSIEREHTRNTDERRDKPYSRSHSNERQSRDYHDDYYYERGRLNAPSNDKRSYDDRKRPRTPSQSPKRPQTPQKSPITDNNDTDNKSDKLDNADSNNQIDLEEFEPILSDEDILDDNQDYQDSDYDLANYTNNDDLIKLFIPGVNELKKYEKQPNFIIDSGKVILNESFKITISILEDFFKSSITKFNVDNFQKLNSEIKEEFIHLCEKLMNLFDNYNNFNDLIKLYQTNETIDLDLNFIVETLIDWLKIALDYNLANCQDQPPYKIRHIKCGIRLIEFCAQSCEFLELLVDKEHLKIDEILLGLYDQEYMALSIKLMILKALDTYLLHKYTIEKFLSNNGYKILINNLRKNPLVRLKFSLNSIIKKQNLYELLSKFVEICRKLQKNEFNNENLNFLIKSLNELTNLYKNQFILSQPKRFLPVSSQFDINRKEQRNLLLIYFEMFNIFPCFLLLLTNAKTQNSPLIKTNILQLLNELLKSNDGLDYLTNNCDCLNLLLKLLLNNEFFIENFSYNLGFELAYKIHIKYLIDYLFDTNQDCNSADILDQLHNFYCLTFNIVGKKSCAQVLCLEDNINCLLKFVNDKYKKSIGLLYIIDLLHLTIIYSNNVTFIEKFSKEIQQIVNFELDDQNKQTEIRSYLINDPINWDNITNYVNNINKQIDNVCAMPGQLICNLRILQYLGISSLNNNYLNDPLNNFNELKYKYVILQLYGLDGMAILTRILTKLCDFYEQPNLHTTFYVSNQSILLLNIIEPCLNLLKHMLTYVIQCYDDFKDLTTVPVLLRTYNLLNAFPSNSQNYLMARELMEIIVDLLLVYTQPINDKISENDSLNKTLWTLMIGEILKFITSAPYTFVSGLLVFSELLPLPLPIQSKVELEKNELLWLINLRKLWSAHLHSHQVNIQEMIAKLCTTANQQLLNLLRRICVQLADLSANTALVVAKGVLDVIFDHFTNDLQFCSVNLCKILNFLACLVTHNTLKCAVLYLINSVEKYPNLIQIFQRFLKVTNQTNTHIQAQECILSIFQSFCDVEITLLTNNIDGKNSDIYLANALPTKDNLLIFLTIMIEHLSNNDNSFVTYLPIMRTFLLLTEHDYGFYYLKENLLKIKSNFSLNILNKFVRNFSKDNAECLSTLNTFVEFLRVCCCISSEDENLEDNIDLLYTSRTMKMNFDELRELVGWGKNGDVNDGDEKHPFVVLEEILKKLSDEDVTFESLLENVSTVIKLLNTESPEVSQTKETNPPELPEPDSLLSQFSCRTIYTLSSTDICNERLTIHYWLTSTQNDDINDLDTLIQSDLTEICRQYLSTDYNLIKELEKLCKINNTTNSNTNNNNEESQNQLKKIKKTPYITPMRSRGFPRTTQQRSDLFRSRPPNTSRPPSLHVDDFVALETCGAQPTGPTGYNKFSRELLASTRIARGSSRGRAFVTSERSMQCRQMSWWGTGLGRSSY